MKVVLDTNIIFQDFAMESPNFKILFNEAKQGIISLYLPQVILDEVINKYGQEIQKHLSQLSKSEQTLVKLKAFPLTGQRGAGLSSIVKNYEKHIHKIIEENKIIVVNYPTTHHQYLAKKAMLRKKPFKTSERGYRDSLIWENIKSLISHEDEDVASSPELAFISHNSTDFQGDGNELHLDLQAELTKEGFITDSIVIYGSLSDYVNNVSKLYLIQADRFKGKLKNDEFWDFKLKEAIDEFLFKEFIHSSSETYYPYAQYANDTPEISDIDDSYEIQDIEVRKLSSNEYTVDVFFELSVGLDYFIDKSDYWSSEDVEFSILDSDWNRHVMHVNTSAFLPLTVTLIITSGLEILSIEVTKVGEEFNI